MSDLAATNCGCGCDFSAGGNSGCNILFLILLLCCCGGNLGGIEHNGCGCGCGNGCDILWIILLLCCCGNGNSCCC